MFDDKFAGLTDAVGTAAGSLAGMRAADAASGLPDTMLWSGVTDTTVYGFAGRSRHATPTELVFRFRERAALSG